MNNEHKITDTLQGYYDKVFQDGKLVNIHIGMWGMSYNLTEEDIKLDNKLPDTIKLGKKMLIKPAVYNKFKNIEQKIRKYLYVNSFDFPLVSQAHFVPKSKYLEVYTKLNEMRDEYLRMVDEFVEKYEDYKQEAIDYYKEHQDTVNVADLEAYYPSAQHVRNKFHFDIVSFEIALPAEFKELNLQDEINREIAGNEVKNQMRRDYKQKYDQQLNTHMSKVGDFMSGVAQTLRSQVTEFCNTALTKIKKKEVVSPATIQSILKKVEEVRSMNFLDDKLVEQQLSSIEGMLNSDRNFEDKDAVAALNDYLTTAVKEVANASDVANVSGEYFRKLR
jgi:hypothetical protein